MTVVPGARVSRDRQSRHGGIQVNAGPNTGILIFGLTAVVSLVALTGNPWLICVAAALAGLLVSAVFQRLPRVLELRLEGPGTLTAGEVAPFRLLLTNCGRRTSPPLTLTMQMPGVREFQHVMGPVEPGQTYSGMVDVYATTRGAPQTAVVQWASADPLHLIGVTLRSEIPARLVIHPVKVSAPELSHTSDGELPQQRSSPASGQDPAGVRPYRRGDSRGSIHWRTTARRDQLVVVERESRAGQGQVVVVAGAPHTLDDELVIATAAAVATRGIRDGHRLKVLAWEGTGATEAPLNQPSATLNWFSRTTFDLPSPDRLVGRLPGWARSVAVATPASTPGAWRHEVEAAVVALGGEITWLAPAAISPAQRAALSEAWEELT